MRVLADYSFPKHHIYPVQEKLNYPAHKRRTREKVDTMRQAEANMDKFWAAIDTMFENKTGMARHPIVQTCLATGGEMRRTAPWVEPIIVKRPTAKKQDYEYQRLSRMVHNKILEITGAFDKSSIEEKPQVKTRGVAVFGLSDQHGNMWAATLATELERMHFPPCDSGADQGFQQAYHELLTWYARCESIPIVSNIQPWLFDYVAPALIKHFSKKITLAHIAGCSITPVERKTGLVKIFANIAKANLRLVLLRAQGSFVRMQLGNDGSHTLLQGSPIVGWDVLKNMAIDTEPGRACQVKNKPLYAQLRAKHQEMINSAAELYKEKYESLARTIETIEKYKLGVSQKYPRWASKDAYLQDAHAEDKLVEDDGIKLLVFKIRPISLPEILNTLEPNYEPTMKDLSWPRRQHMLKDLVVHFHYAYGGRRTTHKTSLPVKLANSDQALVAFVKATEKKIVDAINANSFPDELATQQYVDEVRI